MPPSLPRHWEASFLIPCSPLDLLIIVQICIPSPPSDWVHEVQICVWWICMPKGQCTVELKHVTVLMSMKMITKATILCVHLSAECLHLHAMWTSQTQHFKKTKTGPSSLYWLSNFAKQTIPKHSGVRIIYISTVICGLTGLYWAVLAQGLRWWLGLELPESFFNPISGTWNGWLDRIRSGEASLSLSSPHIAPSWD